MLNAGADRPARREHRDRTAALVQHSLEPGSHAGVEHGKRLDAIREQVAGDPARHERLDHALTNDTALGVMRYADAGYDEALDEVAKKDVPYIRLG